MWPKIIAQLVELLPHVSRLVPMADSFLSSKAAAERASESAMIAMAEGVRGDLGQVTAAHAGLYRSLQDLSAQIVEIGHETRASRQITEQQQHRIDAIEHQIASLGLWVKGGVSVLAVLAAVILGLLLHLPHTR